MTIPLVLILGVAIVLAVRMQGAQWPHMVLGMVFAKSLTPGGTLDNLLGEVVILVNKLVQSVVDGASGLF